MANFLLTFIDETTTTSFSAVGQTIPRKGEVVSYVLCPTLTTAERAEWDNEALADNESLRGKQFEVLQVQHEFRKSLVMKPEVQLIFLMVREVLRDEEGGRPER